MIAVTPLQIEHLNVAYQLLSQAECPTPTEAYILGHFKTANIAGNIQSELIEHFIENHGLDEETATQAAGTVKVKDAVVRIPLTVDVLRSILGLGLILDGDEGAVLLDSGETLPITLSRDMRIRVGIGSLWNLSLASSGVSIDDYFRRTPEN